MNDEDIQQDIRFFIADYIDSVVQLEVLLLLHNSPQQQWTAADIARELRIDAAWAEAQLADLCDRKLLHCPDSRPATYRYAPQTEELHQAVRSTAEAYEQRRVSVINLIYSKPAEKLKSFADALQLRKDQSGETSN